MNNTEEQEMSLANELAELLVLTLERGLQNTAKTWRGAAGKVTSSYHTLDCPTSSAEPQRN